jgi:hypothetical protein
VPDTEFTVDQPDVCFDAAEALVESVQKGAGMFIVIVGMGAEQRQGVGCSRRRGRAEPEAEGEAAEEPEVREASAGGAERVATGGSGGAEA